MDAFDVAWLVLHGGAAVAWSVAAVRRRRGGDRTYGIAWTAMAVAHLVMFGFVLLRV
jgi:hypothetical protein